MNTTTTEVSAEPTAAAMIDALRANQDEAAESAAAKERGRKAAAKAAKDEAAAQAEAEASRLALAKREVMSPAQRFDEDYAGLIAMLPEGKGAHDLHNSFKLFVETNGFTPVKDYAKDEKVKATRLYTARWEAYKKAYMLAHPLAIQVAEGVTITKIGTLQMKFDRKTGIPVAAEQSIRVRTGITKGQMDAYIAKLQSASAKLLS